ncbi:hypothetical protein HNQ91_003058 [Filimonas zeae]|uniref:PRTase ComF-like n=1 Tax=Filimonas zeae TaxID=1737353 RepID=A0A917J0Y1_9BACT|nr:phosphoribosyltransferase family protein [Filimonas zeae]MDR6339993.1 hypothetical protein [Filimonas zeae]GGH70627.1 hypothetical protein GCM10011379_29110 [Filimonas zeae]
MFFTFSLHKIQTHDRFAFEPAEYSRFKFGCGWAARRFGAQLAQAFIEQYLKTGVLNKQLVVAPSPYAFIPTATFALKNYFVFELNRWLAENDLPVVQETKVHRKTSYKEDYGALNAEERMQLIGQDSFHIDRAFLEDKTVLFLDDIRITGSHERMILKMVQEYQLNNDMGLLYFAELTNPDIHPNIENHLNYFEVKDIFDLEPIIESRHFFINTRIVKYILNYESAPFRIFLQNRTDEFVHNLYNMALGNSYHMVEAYLPNLHCIRDYIYTNNFKLIHNGN